jgi:hypothetical protein
MMAITTLLFTPCRILRRGWWWRGLPPFGLTALHLPAKLLFYLLHAFGVHLVVEVVTVLVFQYDDIGQAVLFALFGVLGTPALLVMRRHRRWRYVLFGALFGFGEEGILGYPGKSHGALRDRG